MYVNHLAKNWENIIINVANIQSVLKGPSYSLISGFLCLNQCLNKLYNWFVDKFLFSLPTFSLGSLFIEKKQLIICPVSFPILDFANEFHCYFSLVFPVKWWLDHMWFSWWNCFIGVVVFFQQKLYYLL